MPKLKLTNLVIKNLQVTDRQTDYFDDRFISGGSFGVRVSATGTKSFVVLYRREGRKRRYTIGPYPAMSLSAARKEAISIVSRVSRGEDPAQDKKEKLHARTFGELADLYLEKHARVHKKPAGAMRDEQMIKAFLRPKWKNRKLGASSGKCC